MPGHAQLLRDSYAARLSRRGLAPRTREKYLRYVEHYLVWLGKPPAEATPADVEDYFDACGEKSLRVRISAIKSFYRYLDSRDQLPGRNPTERVESPKNHKKDIAWLRGEEDRAVLDACANDQEVLIIYLLRWTGLRVSEACSLTVADVDTERGEIRVRESKTASGIRIVPILDELGAILLAHLARLRERPGYSTRMPLLVRRSGTAAMSPQYVWRVVKRVGERAGLAEPISPHTLRRTYGSHLLNSGVRMDAVSKALGHANPAITAAAYAEMLDQTAVDEIRAAVAV